MKTKILIVLTCISVLNIASATDEIFNRLPLITKSTVLIVDLNNLDDTDVIIIGTNRLSKSTLGKLISKRDMTVEERTKLLNEVDRTIKLN